MHEILETEFTDQWQDIVEGQLLGSDVERTYDLGTVKWKSTYSPFKTFMQSKKNHCKVTTGPTSIILMVRLRVNKFTSPIFFMACKQNINHHIIWTKANKYAVWSRKICLTNFMVSAFLLNNDVTMLSAGFDTRQPTAPAVYPAKHVTLSCLALEQSSLLLLRIVEYRKSTVCSNVENITIETAEITPT